jgi:hypothetical protein
VPRARVFVGIDDRPFQCVPGPPRPLTSADGGGERRYARGHDGDPAGDAGVAPNQPELQVTFMKPGPPLDADAADFIRRQLEKGQMGGLGLSVDDCRKSLGPALRGRGRHAGQLR